MKPTECPDFLAFNCPEIKMLEDHEVLDFRAVATERCANCTRHKEKNEGSGGWIREQ